MRRNTYPGNIPIIFTVLILFVLIITPLYAQDGGNGKGKGKGKNQNQEVTAPDQSAEQPADSPSEPEPASSEPRLACQKNNPDRLDCSSLEVTGYCDGTTAVFVIRNTGESGEGDMVSPTAYQLLENGTMVQSGSVQIGGGQTTEIRYSGSGDITLTVDQQVGHPGSSHPRVTLNCGAPAEPTTVPTDPPTPTQIPTQPPTSTPTTPPTPTPTEEVTPEPTLPPTATPTQDVTPEPTFTPTDEAPRPSLYAINYCNEDGSVGFYVGNRGDAMTVPVYYTVTDSNGNILEDGWIQLGLYEGYTIEVGPVYGTVTLQIGDDILTQVAECYTPTEEVYPPNLYITNTCADGDVVIFEILNVGYAMTEPMYYTVTDVYGNYLDEGWLQLDYYESMTINVGPQSGLITLVVGDWLAYSQVECYVPTEEVTPTEAVTPEPTFTPTATPTDEPTPEVTPTAEVTPTEEVTPEPTIPPTGTTNLACQKNNPDRLDCSSLEVTSYCDGSTAVFVIYNSGEAGEGDMLQATEYRLFQNNALVETGTVQIAGGTWTTVSFSGGGRITLQADQQIGHPGKSLPQSTLTCG
ncbi:MAG: hypothetical protein CL610_29015 [Anaerolineaceae bacterium]|nr:hypothetical protein [Anaerolineaceae bacterium]